MVAGRPERPAPPVPELPARLGAVAEAAARSEAAGWRSCCSAGAARRQDSILALMPSWDLLELLHENETLGLLEVKTKRSFEIKSEIYRRREQNRSGWLAGKPVESRESEALVSPFPQLSQPLQFYSPHL